MGKIIDANKLKEHNIQKFQFGVVKVEDTTQNEEITSNKEENKENEEQESQSKEEFAKLLQKTDELSSENVKLQMRIESLEKELEDKIAQIKEEQYQKGRKDGIKETQESMEEENQELKSRLIKSITLLDETLLLHKSSIEKIEENIQDIAISFAQKIINKELEEDSHKVAISLINLL